MKKILTLMVALVTFSYHAMAFEHEPQEGLSTQIFLGFNASKIKNFIGYDGKIGGVAGVNFRYMLPKAHGTYLNAGVDWTQKGAQMKDILVGSQNFYGTIKNNLHYIEIPIHVGFQYNISQELGFFGEFGPYFAVGVGGKNKLVVDGDGQAARDLETSYKIFKKNDKAALDNPYFQRWDAGLGFRIGAEYNQRYNLTLGCDWGMTDMYRDKYRDAVIDKFNVALPELKNFNFTIALGYRF